MEWLVQGIGGNNGARREVVFAGIIAGGKCYERRFLRGSVLCYTGQIIIIIILQLLHDGELRPPYSCNDLGASIQSPAR